MGLRTLEAELGMTRRVLRGVLEGVSAGGASAHGTIARGARRVVLALAAVTLCLWARPAAAACGSKLTTRVIPLPVWATLPNEGDTWGVMPVFVRVCPDTERTEAILAPGVTWNSVIRFTGTVRWYDYPADDTTLTVIASASTRINYNGLVWCQKLPDEPGRWSDEVTLRAQRSAFFRFFGLGPDTPASAESSFTGRRTFATARRGWNVARHLNVGLLAGVERDDVESLGVEDLPLATRAFPDVPGMRGATLLWQGASVRYDDRRGGDYAERGVRLELSGAVVEGLAGSPAFLRAGFQASGVVRERAWLSGAGRFAWSAVSAGDVPFYQQSKLGGSFLLRGFTQDRFVDRQAWELELRSWRPVLAQCSHVRGFEHPA
jgi:hypothetical protein